MWIVDNILRGLSIMMRITLLLYSFIFVFFVIRGYLKENGYINN